jgi:hypothetical protein
MLYASTAGRDEKDNRLGNKRATAILEKFLALNYSESQRRRWLSICSQLLRFGWLLINFLARCNFPVLSEAFCQAPWLTLCHELDVQCRSRPSNVCMVGASNQDSRESKSSITCQTLFADASSRICCGPARLGERSLRDDG